MAPETSSVGGSLAWATGEVRAHGQSRRRQRGSSRLKIRRVVGRLATTRTSPPRSRILRAALSTAAYPFASMNSTPSRSTRRDPSAFAAAALRASAKRPAVRASISPRAATTIDLADPLRRLTSATGSQGVMSRPRTASLDQSPLQTRARLERGRDRRMVRKAFLIDRLKGVDEVLGALARLSFGDQVLLAHGIVQPLELRQDFEVIHHHSRSPCLVWSSASDVVFPTHGQDQSTAGGGLPTDLARRRADTLAGRLRRRAFRRAHPPGTYPSASPTRSPIRVAHSARVGGGAGPGGPDR